MKLHIHCSECAWWEIRGNYGALCWRPGDGPELMAANEQACASFERREDGDDAPAGLWASYHDRSAGDVVVVLKQLRSAK